MQSPTAEITHLPRISPFFLPPLWTTCQLIWHFTISWALFYCQTFVTELGKDFSELRDLIRRNQDVLNCLFSLVLYFSFSGIWVRWCQLDKLESTIKHLYTIKTHDWGWIMIFVIKCTHLSPKKHFAAEVFHHLCTLIIQINPTCSLRGRSFSPFQLCNNFNVPKLLNAEAA